MDVQKDSATKVSDLELKKIQSYAQRPITGLSGTLYYAMLDIFSFVYKEIMEVINLQQQQGDSNVL